MTLLDKPAERDSTPDARPVLRLPSKATVVKTGKWGGGGLGIAGVVLIITNISFFEPQLTEKTNLRIDGVKEQVVEVKEEVGSLRNLIVERTRGIATHGKIRELEDKDLILARAIDGKASKDAIHEMELRILDRIDSSTKEMVRLLVAKGKQKRNGDGE